jgi:LDH2 family malate/lactate/ureidoglycolate dehydrogenase
LRTTVQQLFRKVGLNDEDAVLGADVLLYSDLRGNDTHGVSNMLRSYLRGYNEGTTNTTPVWKVVHETASTAVVDGDGGLGNIIAPKVMQYAIEKAAKSGSCGIVIKNSGHAGAVGYHALLAAKSGMLGMAMTAGGNAMLPTFGAEPRLGTNPIAFASPAKTEPAFVFDAAMTSIAGNKIGLARRMGRSMEPGWLGQEDGTPDMEGGQTSEFEAGSIRRQLPLGSTRELGSHKGYGLAMMVEILCGPLAAAPGFAANDPRRRGHFVQAWDIAGFCDRDQYLEDMDNLLETMRTTKPIPGQDRVLYAGLPESEVSAERMVNGIPLHNEVVDWFRDICAEMSVGFTLTD